MDHPGQTQNLKRHLKSSSRYTRGSSSRRLRRVRANGNDEVGVVRMERAMVWSRAFMASLLASSHVQAQRNNQAKRGRHHRPLPRR